MKKAGSQNGARKFLVFDWDGTLVDSAPIIVANMQRAILDLGLPARPDERIAEMIGLDMRDGLGRLFPELETEALFARLSAHHAARHGTEPVAPVFPGVEEALQALQDSGHVLAVATGRQRASLDDSLRLHPQLAPLFAWTFCADETRAKPHPAMLETALSVSGFAAKDTLMLGDTEYDIVMAGAAGVDAVGVTTGSHADVRLKASGAVAVLPSVAELPQWLALTCVIQKADGHHHMSN